MTSKKITKNSRISEVLQANKNAVQILMESGMACIGCPISMQESLEDGCKAHGMSDKEIEELVKKLNK
jgi:hybrid cluster-associated redox disulfide protein